MKRLLLAIAIALTATSAEAQTWVKQSTARDVLIGPFVDETDAKTPETGLASASISLHKGIGAPGTITLGTHIGGGMYAVNLTTSDTDTLGEVTIVAEVSGALPVWKTLQVVPTNTYDSLMGGTDYLLADAKEIDGSPASSALATANEIAEAMWGLLVTGNTDSGSFGELASNIYSQMIKVGPGNKYTYENTDVADGQTDPNKDNVTITETP